MAWFVDLGVLDGEQAVRGVGGGQLMLFSEFCEFYAVGAICGGCPLVLREDGFVFADTPAQGVGAGAITVRGEFNEALVGEFADRCFGICFRGLAGSWPRW